MSIRYMEGDDEKKDLIDRWQVDSEWINRKKKIQKTLKEKNGNDNYVKIDLRGLKFAETDKHCPWIENRVFIEVDFSYADFSRCKFVKCKFKKCIFNLNYSRQYKRA